MNSSFVTLFSKSGAPIAFKSNDLETAQEVFIKPERLNAGLEPIAVINLDNNEVVLKNDYLDLGEVNDFIMIYLNSLK